MMYLLTITFELDKKPSHFKILFIQYKGCNTIITTITVILTPLFVLSLTNEHSLSLSTKQYYFKILTHPIS